MTTIELAAGSFTGPLDVLHLAPFSIQMEVEIEGVRWLVPVTVEFSKHCYTREFKDGDDASHIHYFETRRGGDSVARVVCASRLEFSRRLPRIMQEIGHALCHRGGTHQLVFRQERSARSCRNDVAGWYVCMEIQYLAKEERTRLMVTSAHHRDTLPSGIRGGKKRFWSLFQESYLVARQTRPWLHALETKKAPR